MIWQVNLDDNEMNGLRTSGKFFRDMTGVLNQLGRDQLHYVNLPRPLVVPSGSLIGVRTMSTQNRDCHSAEDSTAITIREDKEADAEEEQAWKFSGNLTTPYFQQLVKIYRYGLEDSAHVEPTPPGSTKQEPDQEAEQEEPGQG